VLLPVLRRKIRDLKELNSKEWYTEYCIIINTVFVYLPCIGYFHCDQDRQILRLEYTCGNIIHIKSNNLQEWSMILRMFSSTYSRYVEQYNG
jgi:hypothetical protein